MEVALVLTGTNVDPAAITQVVALAPTATWRTGEHIERTLLTRKEDGWVFALPKVETLDFGEHLLSLLNALETHRDRIVTAARKFALDTEISCAIYMNEVMPSVHLTPELLHRIAALGADLDLDLINIGSDAGSASRPIDLML
jgi:hypothetical protein